MATIQEKLSVLANTVERADDLTNEQQAIIKVVSTYICIVTY